MNNKGFVSFGEHPNPSNMSVDDVDNFSCVETDAVAYLNADDVENIIINSKLSKLYQIQPNEPPPGIIITISGSKEPIIYSVLNENNLKRTSTSEQTKINKAAYKFKEDVNHVKLIAEFISKLENPRVVGKFKDINFAISLLKELPEDKRTIFNEVSIQELKKKASDSQILELNRLLPDAQTNKKSIRNKLR